MDNLFNLPKEDKVRAKVLTKVLAEIRAIRPTLAGGPLKDAYGLTECFVLKILGKRAEALQMAKDLGTPDSQVFIEDDAASEAKP